ncbi:zinc finger, PHD-type containing protein [Tanacetum coccineum]
MEVLQHEHPLTLIDLNPEYPRDEVVYDDEEELIMKQDFRCLCGRCGQEINFYHRYYVHTDCATTSKKAALLNLSSGDGCNFVLHAWCTRFPANVKLMDENGTYNSKLFPQVPEFMGVFRCCYCELPCNGFRYNIRHYGLDYNSDVHCAFTPLYITHKSHPNHILLLQREPSSEKYCRLCLCDAKKQLVYTCEPCEFTIHPKCALLWPDTISHKYDKHQLTLRYFPVENYSGDYFCEVCEEEFNPNGAFYHCDQCVQSMHPACCVPILQKETTHTHFYPDVGVAQFDNIKFGDSFKVNGHPHVVSLCRGVESDGECAKCGKDLEDKLILKCLQCKFAIDRDCVRKYDYSPKPVV